MARKRPKAIRLSHDEVKGILDPFGTNHREGILYVLSHCRTARLPSDTPGLINDAVDASSDVQAGSLDVKTLITKGKFDKNAKTWSSGSGQDGFAAKLPEWLTVAVEKVTEWVWSLVKFLGGDGYAIDAAKWVIQQLPDLLKKILGGILSNLTGAFDIAKGLYGATKAGVAYYSTRNYAQGIKSGHPKIIVKSVRDQIKDSCKDGLWSAVKAGAMMGITAASAGVGSIVGAIASAYSFIKKLFEQYRHTRKLKAIFAVAPDLRRDGLHRKPAAFQKWFTNDVIKDLPVISAYCMTMPLTGSYYGFLTAVSYDGSQMSEKQLKRNYRVFNNVKKWASTFVQDYAIKLHSPDAIVNHSLKTARQENAFAHSAVKQGRFARMKGALKSRFLSTGMQAIESAM